MGINQSPHVHDVQQRLSRNESCATYTIVILVKAFVGGVPKIHLAAAFSFSTGHSSIDVNRELARELWHHLGALRWVPWVWNWNLCRSLCAHWMGALVRSFWAF